MTDPTKALHALALSVTRGDLRLPWSVQTSNSFRRIGTDRGDGDVLCAITQHPDGHPDLHAAPDVLDYIVAAHPLTILQLLRERDEARHALHLLRHKISGHVQAFREASGVAGVPLADEPALASWEGAVAIVQHILADLTDRRGLRQAWEGIDDGIRCEIMKSWAKIAEDLISEVTGATPPANAGASTESTLTEHLVNAEAPTESTSTAPLVNAGAPTESISMEHPPIASYTLGQLVTFYPDYGDRWHPGIVTRLESGLRHDGSAWHTIFVSKTQGPPHEEWASSAGVHGFTGRNITRVKPRQG